MDRRSPKLLCTLARALILAIATGLCAALSGIGAFATFKVRLPPTDEAYGQPLLTLLEDPFVSGGIAAYALLAGVVAYPFALVFLLRTRLRLSIPLVAGTVGLTTTATCALLNPVWALLAGLWVGVIAMCWSRHHLALPPPA